MFLNYVYRISFNFFWGNNSDYKDYSCCLINLLFDSINWFCNVFRDKCMDDEF